MWGRDETGDDALPLAYHGTNRRPISADLYEGPMMRKLNRTRPLIALFGCLLLLVGVAGTHAEPAREKPRYTMASGKGWNVCETYLKFLNALPASEETLRCDLKLKQVSGMRELDWQEMDIAKNLPIVHQIELILGIGYIEPNPEKDFERWKVQRNARIKANGEQPRLRRGRFALAADGPVETVLSYNVDINRCEKEVKIAKTGAPAGPGHREPTFFVFDEAKQRVMGSGYWTSMTNGVLTLFQGKPYYIELGFGDYGPGGAVRGAVIIKRLEPVPFSEVRELTLPDMPWYGSHELCDIRFDYPFPRFNPPFPPR